MRVRKAIQKIAAIGAGISMIGATLMGAMAADLSEYPGKLFFKNGQFNGVIVVGDKAAAEDVVGSIDIATSLQYAVAQPVAQPTSPGGSGGELSVTGDAVSISEPNDMLEIRERIGKVKETLTEFDLAGLQGGTIVTDEGSSDYNQYLRFETSRNFSATNYVDSGEVQFTENNDDVVGDYLVFSDGKKAFQYELEFEEGVQSDMEYQTGTSGTRVLKDIEDEELNILGKVFSIVGSKITPGLPTSVTLALLGGDVLDTLEEGETRTYTIDGKEYEVTAVIVADTMESVKFSVNGEITDELKSGETDILRDGTEIGVRDLMPNEAEEETGGDIVEFFLGANKVELKDGNVTGNDEFDTSGVKIHEESIEDASVKIKGAWATANETLELSSIQYVLKADSPKGDIFIAPGHGLREYLDEPEGMLSDDWDIRYEGLADTGVSVIRFDASGNDAYHLQFTNREGLEYDIPFVDNSQDDAGSIFKYGDEDDDLIFIEGCLNVSSGGCPAGNASVVTALWNTSNAVDADGSFYPIDEGDYFVLTDSGGNSFKAGDETSFTHILTYESIDTTNHQITFNDQATGQRELTYTVVDASGVAGTADTLIVGGNTYKVWISTGAMGAGDSGNGKYPIAVDLNADGDVAFDQVDIVVNGGGILRLGGLNWSPLDQTNGFFNDGVDFAVNEVSTTLQWSALRYINNTRTLFDNGTINSTLENFVNMPATGPVGETAFAVWAPATTTGTFAVSLTTLASEFDGTGVLGTGRNEFLYINVSGLANKKVDLNVLTLQAFNETPSTDLTVPGSRIVTMLRTKSLDEEDLVQGLSTYGVFFEQTDESSSDNAEDLTIEYPLQQRGADVFITVGSTQTTRVGASSQGAVVLNPITVGSAKLASEVAGQETTQNMMSIGGPCINSVTAKLMGSDVPLCGAESGLKEGEAVVKLYENGDFVAMTVSGWSKEDTRRATKVLAEYQKYADSLTGNEVVVSGTSLSDITVSAPAVATA